ncbi:MAG: hypothetical protein A2Y33_07460 [Spirochaetes bacterium GWF1_51_8]|nr:MAG: hypothetical protein A2Y33_07460 [Spirochaetes bacterium GWF1_51_8]
MNVLVYTQSKFILERFVDALFPAGISVYHIESSLMIHNKIEKNKIDVLIADLTAENLRPILNSLSDIRGYHVPAIRDIIVILFVGNVTREIVARVLLSGADGYVMSTLRSDKLIQYIMKMYNQIKKGPPSLRFESVKLNPDIRPEYIAVKLLSPAAGQSILGVMLDLSLGGMAIRLVGTYDKNAIEKGMLLQNINFILLGHEIHIDGMVVAYKKDICAIMFTQLTEGDRHEICQFLFMKLAKLV